MGLGFESPTNEAVLSGAALTVLPVVLGKAAAAPAPTGAAPTELEATKSFTINAGVGPTFRLGPGGAAGTVGLMTAGTDRFSRRTSWGTKPFCRRGPCGDREKK